MKVAESGLDFDRAGELDPQPEPNGLLSHARLRFTAGDFGGRCFRATCHNTGASWHHRVARRYYCETCATEINLDYRRKGEPAICTRQGLGLSRSY